MRGCPRGGGVSGSEAEGPPWPSGEICAAACGTVPNSDSAATAAIAPNLCSVIAPTPCLFRSLFGSWPFTLDCNYGRSYIGSTGLAAGQGTVACRARGPCWRGVSRSAEGFSRAVRRCHYPGRRLSDRRGARGDAGRDRIRPARPVPGRRPALPLRERGGTDAQHDLAVSPADPRLL